MLLTLETRDPAHVDEVLKAIRAAGFSVSLAG